MNIKRTFMVVAVYASIVAQVYSAPKPNIIFILVDDMGWSDIGCYGGEIKTPNIDNMAEKGVRFTQAYNTAKCFPSRAVLLTGVYAQQCGMSRGYPGIQNAVTLAEVLKSAGYRTLASGKHHSKVSLHDRGFDHYYGLNDGCCNFWNPGKQREGEPPPARKRVRHWTDDDKKYQPYTPKDRKFYTTDVFTDKALGWLDESETKEKPFFLYLAYNAPHYPLHAWPEDIAKYKGVYDGGYDAIRKARYERQVKMGLIDPDKTKIEFAKHRPPRPFGNKTGESLEKEKLRMEIYAAMLDRVDQNIGRLIKKLDKQGRLKNTVIFFASDNGACAEGANAKQKSSKIEDFGKVNSYEVVGKAWATVQNTPLRFWKNYSHEGGICTPLIAYWPGKIKNPGRFDRQPVHFIDIMATLVDLSAAKYPKTHKGKAVVPMQGKSLLPALQGKIIEREKPLFWQWSNGGAVRDGEMKAVFWGKGKWDLYDISKDRNENNNLAGKDSGRLKEMIKQWNGWYKSTAAGKKGK